MSHATAQVISAHSRATDTPALGTLSADDDATAVAGFRCLPLGGSAPAHREAFSSLLTAFCHGDPADATLQARLTVTPGDHGALASATLLIGVTRATPDAAVAAAERLSGGLARLLDERAGFRFEPLANWEVDRALTPFPVVDACEFGVREEPVSSRGPRPLVRPSWHPFPNREWTSLVASLDRLGEPLTIGVTLRPTRLTIPEIATLDEILRWQAAVLAPAAVTPRATLLADHAAPDHAERFHLPLYPMPLLEASIWVGAASLLSDLACGGILAAFAGDEAGRWRWRRALRPGELARARDGLERLAAGPILESEADAGGGRLVRLFVPQAAAGLAPLPSGDIGGSGLRRPFPRRFSSYGTPPEPLDAAAGSIAIGNAPGCDGPIPVRRTWNDLLRHSYVIGQTGTGKSSLLGRMALQDMEAGRAVLVVDPTGDLVDDLLARIPAHRRDDVVVVDPTDTQRPLGINVLDAGSPDAFRRAVTEFIGTLYKVYDPNRTGMVGPRLENMFRCSLLAAQSVDGEATLLEVYRLLVDRGYEKWLAGRVKDPYLKRYFAELEMTSDFHRSETVGYFSSKIGRFAADPQLRSVLCQPRARWSLESAIDSGKIVLVTLRQGQLGPETSAFIGGIVMSQLMLAAFARDSRPAAERPPLAVYLDEFQSYATDDAIARILAGIRKYNVAVTLANQHVHQLPGDVREAIFGNVGSIVSLRVGANDAPFLAEALKPGAVTAEELVGLPNFVARVSMLERGDRLPAFDLATLPLDGAADPLLAGRLRERSAALYGRDREEVEIETAARLGAAPFTPPSLPELP